MYVALSSLQYTDIYIPSFMVSRPWWNTSSVFASSSVVAASVRNKEVASFPGSHAWAEKTREPGTHHLRMVQNCPKCLIGSITMQCGLSAGEQKMNVILVKRSSMQVTKGTWYMCEQCVPGSPSSSPTQEPGNEATHKGESCDV